VSQPNHFDEDVAERYDETAADMFDPAVVDPAVDLLASFAGDGAALELGVGTGRLALPLARRGVAVHGVDLSPAMLRRLRDKPGAERIDLTVGDLATVRVPGAFRVVYLAWNTIMNLTSQDAQVECFRTAAAHLEPGGRFVVEVMVPDLQRLPRGETLRPFAATSQHLGFDEYDVVSQRLVSHHYEIGERTAASSIPFRYVWPSELDLMARLAGMRPEERWGGWRREPFTAESAGHVSVWRRSPGADLSASRT
jgi:SAM-dependent methyltransferase